MIRSIPSYVPGNVNYQILDVRPIPAFKRNMRFSEACTFLNPGSDFILVADENPTSILGQLHPQPGNREYAWKLLETGPDVWRILVSRKS